MGKMIHVLIQDIRFGLRAFLKSSGFAVVAVITLALGIGANTAMFSVVNSVLVRSLPFPDSSRVMVVWKTMSNGAPNAFSTPAFLEWREQGGATPPTGGFFFGGVNPGRQGVPDRAAGRAT